MRAVLPLLLVLAVAGCGGSSSSTTSEQKPSGTGTLHTIADVSPPKITVTHPASGTAAGLLFV